MSERSAARAVILAAGRGTRMRSRTPKVVVSANLHVYVYQTDRGELVLGSEIDPYSSYSQVSTLETLESIVGHSVELFPALRNVRILRQWAGICDMTPDYSPIMGGVDGLKGFVLDVGWGSYGFKAGPVSGRAGLCLCCALQAFAALSCQVVVRTPACSRQHRR